jgi:hypothetical protein
LLGSKSVLGGFDPHPLPPLFLKHFANVIDLWAAQPRAFVVLLQILGQHLSKPRKYSCFCSMPKPLNPSDATYRDFDSWTILVRH